MKFEDLTPEQKEKARACKTPEEILALAKAEGYELSDEQLEGVSGGWHNYREECTVLGCNPNHCNDFGCDEFRCGDVTCPVFGCDDYEKY